MSDLARLVAEAVALAGGPHECRTLGHRWKFYGGANCGCGGTRADGSRWSGNCSVPIYRCVGCGDWDYGVNQEAVDIRFACAARDP